MLFRIGQQNEYFAREICVHHLERMIYVACILPKMHSIILCAFLLTWVEIIHVHVLKKGPHQINNAISNMW